MWDLEKQADVELEERSVGFYRSDIKAKWAQGGRVPEDGEEGGGL